MPRTITYQILDKADGRFTVVATMEPDRIYRRDDLATLAEAEDWIEGLRVLMAACGAPVVRAGALAEPHPARPVAMPEGTAPCTPSRQRAGPWIQFVTK